MKNSARTSDIIYQSEKSVIRLSWRLCALSVTVGLAAFVLLPLLDEKPSLEPQFQVQKAPEIVEPPKKLVEPEKVHRNLLKPKETKVEKTLKAPAPPKAMPALNLSPIPNASSNAPALPDLAFNPNFDINSLPQVTPTVGVPDAPNSIGPAGGPDLAIAKEFYLEGELDELPRELSGRQPKYPKNLLRRRLKGEVVARIIIAANGQVQQAEIISSKPKRYFDRSVRTAIKSFYFSPGKINGKAVAVEAFQKFIFNPPIR